MAQLIGQVEPVTFAQADLLTTTAADVRVRKTATASPPNVVSLDRTVRPRRANILDE